MLRMADKLYEQARTATREVRNRISEARLPQHESGPARETNREGPRPAKDSGTQNAEDPMREVRQLIMGLSERMNNIAKETQELRKHAQGTKARQTPPDELELGLFSRARDSAQPPRMDKSTPQSRLNEPWNAKGPTRSRRDGSTGRKTAG